MIDVYLNQMMNRMDFTLDYALDKAFSVQAFPQDAEWEIFQLKRAVIKEAQDLYRPLAKSVLVESFTPKLHKRADDGIDTANVLEETVTETAKDKPISVANDPVEKASKVVNANNEKSVPVTANDAEKVSGNANAKSMFEQVGDAIQNAKEKVKNVVPGIGANSHSSEDTTGGIAKAVNHINEKVPAEMSWNIRMTEMIKRFFSRIVQKLKDSWAKVVDALNLGKIKEFFKANEVEKGESATIFQKFQSLLTSTSMKYSGLAIATLSLSYLVYSFFFKKAEIDDHEYFE